MRVHQARSRITTIQDKHGVHVEDYDTIKEVAIDFYKTLFTEPGVFPEDMQGLLISVIDKSVSSSEQQVLVRPVTDRN
ncbi:hypothetical protein LIER_17654 [Lithospermum erythrorhizon]|uniref:Uncharacterized protein n=1 Tax=Lithospermum erythrorhizon TaxID=34254 RepID=A0AAV3QGM3_LITER